MKFKGFSYIFLQMLLHILTKFNETYSFSVGIPGNLSLTEEFLYPV